MRNGLDTPDFYHSDPKKSKADLTPLSLEKRTLMGRGIGYIDVHLLAASSLTAGANLWTRDKRLYVMADSLNLAWQEQDN